MVQPNILWICTDQQRWDTLSYFDHPGAKTPHIDSLARAGTAFTRAYCQSPICTPSRASFLTGTYPIANQVHRNGNAGFPNHLKLLPKMLNESGYHTGLIGKFHLSRAKGIIEKRPDDGYDEFYWSHGPHPKWETGSDYHDWLNGKGVDGHELYADQVGATPSGIPSELSQTSWAGERARQFIEKNRDDKWMLSINVFDPHPPFDPPPEYLAKFDPDDMPTAIFQRSDLTSQGKIFGKVDQQSRRPVDPTRHHDPLSEQEKPEPEAHSRPPSAYESKKLRARYHAMIAQIDDMVGELINTLEKSGQLDNTLIIFTSDHGEMLGDHGLVYKGCRFYEGLVHVPLIFSYPVEIKKGVVADALVEMVDIAQTILDFVDLAPNEAMQGKSLYGLLTGVSDIREHKPYVLSEFSDALGYEGSLGSRASMYFDGRYKLCVYHDAATGELYDHRKDPGEFMNLWDDAEKQVLKLKLIERHFNAFMKKSGKGPVRVADF